MVKGIFALLILCGMTLLFVVSPTQEHSRLSLELWNLGHFFLFFFISFFWLFYFAHKKQKTVSLLWFMLVCFALALFTELVQLKIPGRTFSMSDIGKDLAGSAYAVLVFLLLQKRISRVKFGLITALLLITLTARPLQLALERWERNSTFPILADFETDVGSAKWVNSNTSVSKEVAAKGKHSLKVSINSDDQYSGVGLGHFPSNWQQFKYVKFSIFVNDAAQININIFDQRHLSNYNYQDRFNKLLNLEKGWNHISIPLHKVKRAPASRLMNMAKIQRIGFFSAHPHSVDEFYIDNVHLTL